MTGAQRFRQIVNVVNLSTVLGLILAGLSKSRLGRGPQGLLIAGGYRWPIPAASAFTLGNVIFLRQGDREFTHRPRLLTHEARHATQYACCFGPLMLPLYLLAVAWSWLRTGDYYSRNIFERLAGLADGDYVEHPVRRLFRSAVD